MCPLDRMQDSPQSVFLPKDDKFFDQLTGGTTPRFTCAASDLEACGYGTYDWVDGSGNYIFIQISPTTTQITKLELQQKRIVDTRGTTCRESCGPSAPTPRSSTWKTASCRTPISFMFTCSIRRQEA
jgi:hypothetical protein